MNDLHKLNGKLKTIERKGNHKVIVIVIAYIIIIIVGITLITIYFK